jgi:hypothetical protein
MKTLTLGQRSFQKITQFTMLNKVQGPLVCNINASLTRAAVLIPQFCQGNKVLGSPVSNTKKFLCIETRISSTQLNRPIFTKGADLSSEIPTGNEGFLSTRTQFSQEYNLLDTPASKKHVFLWGNSCLFRVFLREIHVIFPLSSIGLFGRNRTSIHLQ